MQGLMLLALEAGRQRQQQIEYPLAFGEIGVRKTPWNTFLSLLARKTITAVDSGRRYKRVVLYHISHEWMLGNIPTDKRNHETVPKMWIC